MPLNANGDYCRVRSNAYMPEDEEHYRYWIGAIDTENSTAPGTLQWDWFGPDQMGQMYIHTVVPVDSNAKFLTYGSTVRIRTSGLVDKWFLYDEVDLMRDEKKQLEASEYTYVRLEYGADDIARTRFKILKK
jgi:hypothetical protein